MTAEFLKQLRKWLKTPAHYFLPVLLVSSFGLFAPINILDQLGISQWKTQGKFYLGSAFVISTAIIFCYYFAKFIKWVLYWKRYYRYLWVGHSRLKTLTDEEKIILSSYMEKQSKTMLLTPFSGVVTGLTKANIIYSSADQGLEHEFPFNIREWAWIYLNKNPHLVSISDNIVGSRINKKSV